MPSTRWSWVTLLLLGLFTASLLWPLGVLTSTVIPPSAASPLRILCLALAIALSAGGTIGAVFAAPPARKGPSPPPPDPDALTVGWDAERGWITLSSEAQQRHALVLGSSGSGKTQLLLSLLAQQVARGGGVLMIDAKVDRSALDAVLAICRQANRLHDLRAIWPPNPAVSHTWNPLLRGNLEEILGRVMALWGADTRGEADFWKGSAHTIISAVLGAMRRVNPAVTFNDLYLALTTSDVLLWLEAQTPPGTEESDALAAFLSNYRGQHGRLNLDQLKRLTGGAPQYLYHYAWGDLGRIMNHTAPSLDLLNALNQGLIVYVALPILARTEEAIAMARMLVADFKQAVGALQQQPDKPDPPFLVLLDEASAYANVQGIERLFEQARSANVALVAASQVLSGFAVTNRAQLDFILGNTATKVVMALGDFTSAETMAKTIGEQLAWFATQSTTKDRGTSAPWISPLPTRASKARRDASGSMQRYDYTIRPEQLLNLATGQAVVFARDPETGGSLSKRARTCLTRIDPDATASLPLLPRVGPAGLDIRRLLQRGALAGPPAAAAPGRRQTPATSPEPTGHPQPTEQGDSSTAPATSATPKRRRGVRRRETEAFVILEPKE